MSRPNQTEAEDATEALYGADEASTTELDPPLDNVLDAVVGGIKESTADLVERVAATGANSIHREVDFAGQTWIVEVSIKSA